MILTFYSSFRMCACRSYQVVIMLLVLIVFGIICFISDSDKDSNENYNDIITLVDIKVNTTVLI